MRFNWECFQCGLVLGIHLSDEYRTMLFGAEDYNHVLTGTCKDCGTVYDIGLLHGKIYPTIDVETTIERWALLLEKSDILHELGGGDHDKEV